MLMVPVKRAVQKHDDSKDVESQIQRAHEKPALDIVIVRMQGQQKEWDGIVPELNQRSGNQNQSSGQEISQNPYLSPLNFAYQEKKNKNKYIHRVWTITNPHRLIK